MYMKKKMLLCSLFLLAGVLALPLPGRAQSPDQLLQEAVARRIRVQEKIEAIGLRVQTESYSRDLVDSFLAVFEEQERVDRENLQLIDSLLRDGLPEGLTQNDCGNLLMLVANADAASMKKYLPELRKAADRGLIAPNNMALFEDKLAMAEGRPQRYGTQLYEMPQYQGPLAYIWPVEDPERLDSLRAGVGLFPIGQYVEALERATGVRVVYDPALTLDSLNRLTNGAAMPLDPNVKYEINPNLLLDADEEDAR